MSGKHTYTAREVQQMRFFAYSMAQRSIKNEELALTGGEDASVLALNMLNLTENILQSCLMADLTIEDLRKEYPGLVKGNPLLKPW